MGVGSERTHVGMEPLGWVGSAVRPRTDSVRWSPVTPATARPGRVLLVSFCACLVAPRLLAFLRREFFYFNKFER